MSDDYNADSLRLVRRLEAALVEAAKEMGYAWEFCHLSYRNDSLPRIEIIEMEFRPTDNRCYG